MPIWHKNIAPKAQGIFHESRWKNYKCWRIREFAGRLSPSNFRSYTREVSPACSSNDRWIRMAMTNMSAWMGKGPRGLNTTQRTIGHWAKPRGDPPLLGRENQFVVSCQNNILWCEQVTFRNMYIHLHMCIQEQLAKKRPWTWRRVVKDMLWEGL